MAAEDTAYGKVQAFERAVLAKGFEGILRACRSEAARRSALKGRQAYLIEPDKEDKRSNGNSLHSCLQIF